MRKFITVLLTVCSALFFIFGPAWFLPHLHEDLYSLKESRAEPQFEGLLTLWNVSDTPAGAARQLSYAIARFEKEQTHVFITRINMNAKTAQRRLAEGETPDIIVFDKSGLVSGLSLRALEVPPNLLPAVAETGCREEQFVALPFAVIPHKNEEETEITLSCAYAACVESTDVLRQNMIDAFFETLLSSRVQQHAAEHGLVPVCADENLFETESEQSQIYRLLAAQELSLPQLF